MPADDDPLYEVAKQITHSIGMPWTDPRTLKTYQPEARELTAPPYYDMTPAELRAVAAWHDDLAARHEAWSKQAMLDIIHEYHADLGERLREAAETFRTRADQREKRQ